MSIKNISLILFACLLISGFAQPVNAQTTGKVRGRVTDKATGKPLGYANVVIIGTNRGNASDSNGDYTIINIKPGVYKIKTMMMGYKSLVVEKVRISVNRTSYVNFEMDEAIIDGQTVVVTANRAAIKRDQTSSIRNISSDNIENLPVENIAEVIALQPGVVRGHFRGGRRNEVSFMIDGVEVTEVFGGESQMVEVEPEAIQDVEVITGTFNAEYGQAMSGIVNAITKDGGEDFHGSASVFAGNYFTGNKDIFIGLKDNELDRNKDFRFQLGGPIIGDKLTFFTNVRYQNNKNHLNGVRRFSVNDYSNFTQDDPSMYYSEFTGDSSFVPMNLSINRSYLGKITAKLPLDLKVSLLYTRNDDEWHSYSHEYKYNPDGRAASFRNSEMLAVHFNQMLSKKMFYELKLSRLKNYNGWYKYKNPLDSSYIHDAYHNSLGPGFFTGGQEKGHSRQTTTDLNAKFDLTWQISKHHNVKTGFNLTHHKLDNKWTTIRNKYEGTEFGDTSYYDEITGKLIFPNYEPVVFPDTSIYSDIYNVSPVEYSGYIQDKMEFDEMVINFGIRYDYFDPKSVYPSQRRNPANQLNFPDNPEKMSKYPDTKPQIQFSPRFGLAYQLGDAALLHLSYGHFFQMPPMYAMYENHSFRISPTDYETTMGNTQVKAQKTIQYEIGLWQELMKGMGLEISLFYRDIYNLLSTKIISTFNQIEYGLYTNKDYGNAKGLEVKYDFEYNNLSAFLNYTLQYTRGNADNPTQTFTRAGNSMDPIAKLIPMSWDQRHTLNATVSYQTKNYGATLTGTYNSGTPYTWAPIDENPLANVNLYPNNSWQPSQINVDFTAYYKYKLIKNISLQFKLSIYNLLDRLNEVWVDPSTGRAYTAIIRKTDILSHRSNFNNYIDIIHNPSAYSAPRMIKLGMSVLF